ncbi:MAG: anhydro-N-acetylmuramic acid kinase, partial [Granulosicoccaceae bacterium]
MRARNGSSLYIGLMCGTSADGIDAALVQWQDNHPPKLLSTLEHPLPSELRQSLLSLNGRPKISLRKLALLDTQVAEIHAAAVHALLAQAKEPPEAISAIGFHGQTIDHSPAAPTKNTTQIGNAHLLAADTGIPVIGDLRRADIAVGGQGAPLAPALHAQLFRATDRDVAVVNIGGIANLSLLPADEEQAVLGFDSGPGNCLMDEWCTHCLELNYDKNGHFAKSGKIDSALLSDCLASDYFQQDIPKSTGRDLFNLAWLQDKLQGRALSQADTQATLAALTAHSIANDLKRYQPNTQALFVCGGGAHNTYLMQLIQRKLPNVTVETTASKGVDPDWVEALLMTWLARQHSLGEAGNLPSVTG